MSVENLDKEFKNTAMSSVGMSIEDILFSLRHDAEFLINFFLAEELEFPVPDFHKISWDYLTHPDAPKVAIALPRGHAKTTLAKLAVVWYLLFTDFRFIVYLSNTSPIAAEACKDVIGYLRSENFEAVFGRIVFDVDQDARGFYKFWLHIPDGKGNTRKKFCILRAMGANQQVRGMNIDNQRPQLAIVDDLEDNENTETPALQLKLKRWFFGAFIKAISKKKCKVIYLGNMLSNTSLLHFFCERSDIWHSIRFGSLKSDGTSLWPDMWSVEELRQDFIEYQNAGLISRWFAEMMNLPMSDENSVISSQDIYYRPAVMPGQPTLAFITIDPAVSQKTWADESAVVVHACVDDIWQVVEYVVGRFTPDQLFMVTLGLCLKWNTRAVGIEAGGYQAALKYLFEVFMKIHLQHMEICEVPHKNRPKHERIAVWCGMIRKKQWALTEGEYNITEQLLSYDPSKKVNKDDLIDGASMGVTMTQLYMMTIVEQFEKQTVAPNISYVNVV